MAGVGFSAYAEGVSVGSSTDKVVLMVTAAANHRVLGREILISTDGEDPTVDHPRFWLARLTAVGTGGTTVTPTKTNDADNESIQTTAKKGGFSVEPTVGNRRLLGKLDPTQTHRFRFDYGELPIVGGDSFGVVCNSSVSMGVDAAFTGDE